ncbi:MAG: flagellar motor switch protein FliM [Oscillospiraceae bacterium]|jgi:flagellar motor switch protein FliM|nr:flagellar motor switch protein FliM [Oscillospiraceae bacterium]
MAGVLSQAEIDALLNAIESDGIDSQPLDDGANQIREYDFRTANRFNKEHIRTLRIVYDNFARLFASYLSGTLRAMCSAEVMSVEETKYAEFVNALPSPLILAVVRMPPMTGSVLLEVSPDLSYAIISRLLGGKPDKESVSRGFTEIEQVLLERIMRQFLPLFGESWEKVVGITTYLDRLETSPQFAQIVAMNETVAIISISVKVDEAAGTFNICLPHLALEPISQQLTTKFLYQNSDSRQLFPMHEDIQKRIEQTPLEVSAYFNETQTSVRDILNLQTGDVISLNHAVSDPLTLRVGHLPKFRVEVGMKDRRYAAKITEIIQKEDANNE